MTMQHRQSAVAPLWERFADPRRLLKLFSFDRGLRPGKGASMHIYWGVFARHQRLIRRGGIVIAALAALVTLGCRRPVVAARERAHPARRCDPVACRGHRGEFRQRSSRRGRRHPDRTYRERRHRGAHPRHRGARLRRRGSGQRAESRGARLQLEPAARSYPCRKSQPGRGGNGRAHRTRRRRDHLRRRRQASDRDRRGARRRNPVRPERAGKDGAGGRCGATRGSPGYRPVRGKAAAAASRKRAVRRPAVAHRCHRRKRARRP